MAPKIKLCKLNVALLAFAVAILVFNSVQLGEISYIRTIIASGNTATVSSATGASILPTGIPEIYGKELDISYNDVSASNPQSANAAIGVMADLDGSIEVTGDDLDRYIDIASQISCEYCCGAKSIIFSNGQKACGCAHSYAMRGLAKYLITEHGDEFTDDEILGELAKWKVLFFPTQMTQRATALEENGIEVSYVNLGSNTYRGIEQGSGGGMVGGC
jgi:hypothetical protein